MKLDQNKLRKLILKEMADMSQFHGGPGRGGPMTTPEQREADDDFMEQTGQILDGLYDALSAASLYPDHENMKATIQSCIENVESMIEVMFAQ